MVGHIVLAYTETFGDIHSLCKIAHSMCFFKCKARWSLRAKARSQSLHAYGRIPVCFLMCLPSSSDLENFQPHPSQLHMYGFSPVWLRKCAFMWLALWYVLPHVLYGQLCTIGTFRIVLRFLLVLSCRLEEG